MSNWLTGFFGAKHTGSEAGPSTDTPNSGEPEDLGVDAPSEQPVDDGFKEDVASDENQEKNERDGDEDEDSVKKPASPGGEKSEEDEDDEELPSKLYERLVNCRCCAYCLTRYPRTCAIFGGVIFPLWALILFSMAFGARLCENEAPPEISANDQKLADLYFSTRSSERLVNLTVVLPRVCFVLYLDLHNHTDLNLAVPFDGVDAELNKTIEPILDGNRSESGLTKKEALLTPGFGEEYISLSPETFDPSTLQINVTDLYLFMTRCGEASREAATDLLSRSLEKVVASSDPLTFSWIRCFEGAEESERNYNGRELTKEQRSQQGQAKLYSQTWEEDRERIFNETYSQLLDDGMDPDKAYDVALVEAANGASGGSVCELNAPAAAWFWFTVQTTIGYGNTPPTTSASRAMVFTIGFISILAFGGVLAMAGYILSFLFDDYAARWGMKFLTKPWVGSVIWGSVYYAWMIAIAGVTIWWKQDRLGIDFDMNDGYWFAFISTTTVGLGDIVLEPEGIVGSDLVIFPLLFLVGLMYFAAFVGKFVEVLAASFRKGRKSFVDTLLDKKVMWKETFAKDNPS